LISIVKSGHLTGALILGLLIWVAFRSGQDRSLYDCKSCGISLGRNSILLAPRKHTD
jgi:hypothetical protein